MYILAPKMCKFAHKMYLLAPKMYKFAHKMYLLAPKMYLLAHKMYLKHLKWTKVYLLKRYSPAVTVFVPFFLRVCVCITVIV